MAVDRSNEIDTNAPVTEQAAAWWVLLNEGEPTEADHRAFAEWSTRSPERVGAYLQAAQAGNVFRSPRTPWPDTPVDELIHAAAASPVTRLPVGSSATAADVSASPRSASIVPRLAFAALAAAIVAAIALYLYPRQVQQIQTAPGEQHSAVLSDGSVVTLNTASSIKLDFSRAQRRITLVSGEALFQVARDPSRPFEVTVGDTTVRAVGTKFNVDRHAQSLEVTVLEGRVEVSRANAEHVLLNAGDQLIQPTQGATKVTRASVAVATAWTQRQLIFENQPLGELAAEFNRYNRQTVEIESARLRAEPVTGVFQSNDLPAFVEFLRRIPDASVEASADNTRYIVREAQEP